MKFLLVVVLAFSAVCSSAMADTNGCESDGHHFKVGEKFAPIGQCIEWTCKGPHDMYAKTCPSLISQCEPTPGDPSKPYPGCCPVYHDNC